MQFMFYVYVMFCFLQTKFLAFWPKTVLDSRILVPSENKIQDGCSDECECTKLKTKTQMEHTPIQKVAVMHLKGQ